MKIIDVTRTLFRDTVVYPGDYVPSSRQVDAGNYLISELYLGTHSGTHIDAPMHYLKNDASVDTISLETVIGRCRVLDVRDAGSTITRGDLDGRTEGVERLLLKTTFSAASRFVGDYPCIDPAAARFITGSGIRCVGIDSPSIEKFHGDGTVHRELLGNGCIIIELLDLSGAGEGDYDLVALPLRLAGLDGSPARVVLLDKTG